MFSLMLLWLENCKKTDQKETWIVHHQFADLGDFARICWLNPQMSAETSIHPTLLCLAWSAKDILTTFYLELLELKASPLFVNKPIKAPYLRPKSMPPLLSIKIIMIYPMSMKSLLLMYCTLYTHCTLYISTLACDRRQAKPPPLLLLLTCISLGSMTLQPNVGSFIYSSQLKTNLLRYIYMSVHNSKQSTERHLVTLWYKFPKLINFWDLLKFQK